MSSPTGRLLARVVPPGRITASIRDDMWALFARYYVGAEREVFESDLANKTAVILLVDAGDHSVQGFSTYAVDVHTVEGRRLAAVFSGDTVLERAYWGQTALQRAFFRVLISAKLRHPFIPVYWFLITKGYKTYLTLSRNVPTHYPRWDRDTPAWEARVLDVLARERFPTRWDRASGVLRLESPDCRLREGVAPIDTEALAAPDVHFFVQKNPGHAEGEELCCLGRVDLILAWTFSGKHIRRALAAVAGGGRRPRALRAPRS